MPNALAWRVIERSWFRSIIVLRVSEPCLGPSALAKKLVPGSIGIILQRQFSYPRVKPEGKLWREASSHPHPAPMQLCLSRAKHPGRPFEQMILPLLDLIGVHIELLR